MAVRNFIRGLWLMPLVAAVVLGGWLARTKLNAWTRVRLAEQQQREIAALPEARAVEVVRRLPDMDADASELIAFTLADERQSVAAAARSALAALLESWRDLPVDQRSVRAGQLANGLAHHSPKYQPDALVAAQSAAQCLLLWPVNGRRIDAAGLITDCETVLRLGTENAADAGGSESRLGALPATATDGRVQ